MQGCIFFRCKNTRRTIFFFITVLLLIFNQSFSKTINVPSDYPKIQEALDASSDDDEIIVFPGTYKENILFKGKSVKLRSIEPKDFTIAQTTIVSGAGSTMSTVSFNGTESTSCSLMGFTIRDGSNYYGGGISGNGTKALIQNNIICNNSAQFSGGGIWQCHGSIKYNIITANSGNDGGGMDSCNGEIIGNFVVKNIARYNGGGMLDCQGIILNNTIAFNSTGSSQYSKGSGLYDCPTFIANCIIWGNIPQSSQIAESSTPLYCCIENWSGGGIGNISADPKMSNPSLGNYHLEADSPCIDKGYVYYSIYDNIMDIDGQCRLAGAGIDMGCDEFGSSKDFDGDLMSDIDEESSGTLAASSDTDGDGVMDGIEIHRGSNPLIDDIASTISVPKDFSSIQKALFMSKGDEIIMVSPGTYQENLYIGGKNVILQSANDVNIKPIANAVIDGRNIHTTITYKGSESNKSALRGFSIINGQGYFGGGINGNGAGILIEGNSISKCFGMRYFASGGGLYNCQGLIVNNLISKNTAYDGGGGIAYCNGVIRNNVIENNSSQNTGAGIEFCDGLVTNNIIRKNSADYYGGGIYGCDGIIEGNLVYTNSAKYNGAGISNCNGVIRNTTICNNSSRLGSGLLACTGLIINVIVWNNIDEQNTQIYNSFAPIYSCLQGGGGGVGSFDKDPKFVDSANGDYHLSEDSPCIDKGYIYYIFDDGISDIDGQCRLFGVSTDIGCDEYGASPDTDGDFLSDDDEISSGTNPLLIDTDGDGLSDGKERIRGTNPLAKDAASGLNIPEDSPLIQKAIWYAFENEKITISPGIYSENLRLSGKNLTICSKNPVKREVVEETIINGGKAESVVVLYGNETQDCVIEGLCLTNGYARVGGGIYGNSSKATIRNNIIRNNNAYYTGGGGLAYCKGEIANNIIAMNSGKYLGGGIYNSHATIHNNYIFSNFSGYGGGIASCNNLIQNNIIFRNTGYFQGGGIYSSNGKILNNHIIDNQVSENGAGICECTGIIKNNIVWSQSGDTTPQLYDSSAPQYCCIINWQSGGIGNISKNPEFEDPIAGDFHLHTTSPCIDAGTPDEYLDACLPPGKLTIRNDIGAYGGVLNCGWGETKLLQLSDLTDMINGRKQISDIYLLGLADTNIDGKIDIADIVFFIDNKNSR